MESTIESIITFLKSAAHVFMAVDIHERIFLAVAFILFFTVINLIFTLPIIFNFFIVPKIEKEIGEKLDFNKGYNIVPFWGFMCRYMYVTDYFLKKYFKTKMRLADYSPFEGVNYDINCATKFQIIMCFIAFFTFILLIISVILSISYSGEPLKDFLPFK